MIEYIKKRHYDIPVKEGDIIQKKILKKLKD